MIHKCGKHLSECVCDDVTETLRDLAKGEFVYVGNIIDARIRDGLSKREDFNGVNIYAPYDGPISPPYPKRSTKETT